MSIPTTEDEVLRKMLRTPPKPHEKSLESSGTQRGGRPVEGKGAGEKGARGSVANKTQT